MSSMVKNNDESKNNKRLQKSKPSIITNDAAMPADMNKMFGEFNKIMGVLNNFDNMNDEEADAAFNDAMSNMTKMNEEIKKSMGSSMDDILNNKEIPAEYKNMLGGLQNNLNKTMSMMDKGEEINPEELKNSSNDLMNNLKELMSNVSNLDQNNMPTGMNDNYVHSLELRVKALEEENLSVKAQLDMHKKILETIAKQLKQLSTK